MNEPYLLKYIRHHYCCYAYAIYAILSIHPLTAANMLFYSCPSCPIISLFSHRPLPLRVVSSLVSLDTTTTTMTMTCPGMLHWKSRLLENRPSYHILGTAGMYLQGTLFFLSRLVFCFVVLVSYNLFSVTSCFLFIKSACLLIIVVDTQSSSRHDTLLARKKEKKNPPRTNRQIDRLPAVLLLRGGSGDGVTCTKH